MLTDLRLALRSLVKAKSFTFAAVLTLGLGIGANTVVFSIVNGLLLRPLPFGEATRRIVSIHSVHPTQFPQGWDDAGVSFADLEDVRRESEQLEDVGGYLDRSFTLYGEDALLVQGGSVTPNLFRLIEATPALGRGFRNEEGALPGFEKVVLLSDGLWKSRFGADPSIVGRTVRINERELEVVGVMPVGFRFPERDELWVPYGVAGVEPNRASRPFLAVGRLRPEATLATARAELDAIAERIARRHPEENRGWGLHAIAYRDLIVASSTRVVSTTLLLAVGLVLLVACANLASLLLSRGTARQRELAVRTALGAGRMRLVRQLLAESLLLGALGGVLGAFFAVWGLDASVTSFPEELPYWLSFDLDARVIGFLVVAAVVASLAAGLLPAWRATRFHVVPALGGGRDPAAARGNGGIHNALVVGQIASSLALLVGGGLMFQSFLELSRADLGFDSEPVLTFRVVLAGDAYDAPEAKVGFFRDVTEKLRALPGVLAAAATTSIPADDGGTPARLVRRESPLADGSELGVQTIGVTSGFFDTLDVPLLEGRPFDPRDSEAGAAPVAVVNRRLAERLWPGARATDREVGLVTSTGTEWLRVVGVAPDVQYEELGEETAQSELNVYLPYSRVLYRGMAFLVRGEGEPAELTESVRGALHELAPGTPAFLFRTMSEVRDQTTWEQRWFGELFAAFAVAALALACLGTYGLVAYQAARRTHEIGVRLALGARGPDVLALFLGQGLRIVAPGLALGLGLALGVSHLLEGVVYRVPATSPWLFGTTALVLGLSVLVATYVPARRAARTDPMQALRQE